MSKLPTIWSKERLGSNKSHEHIVKKTGKNENEFSIDLLGEVN
jgi:hypothetical protein